MGWILMAMRKMRPVLNRACSVESCDGLRYAKGFCNKHYIRWRVHGNVEVNLRAISFCSVPDCNKKHRSGGYCNMHYSRKRKHGNPLYLGENKECFICNKTFFKALYMSNKMYCSPRCKQVAPVRRRPLRQCIWCGQLFQCMPNQIKLGYGHFCSRSCCAQLLGTERRTSLRVQDYSPELIETIKAFRQLQKEVEVHYDNR